MSEKDIKIIIAAHKRYQMPESDMYIPLHVGAEGKMNPDGSPLDLGYQKDNTGDNISAKNPYYCELTGIYYAWKNIPADYLGIVHYRRYFAGKTKSRNPFERIVTKEELNSLFDCFRVVVPKKRKYYIETLYSHYAHTHYAKHLDCVRDIIAEKCADYLEAYDKVVKRTSGYMFNMMIMERELFDDYCSWLFAILFELEKRLDTEELSSFQSRFYGRVSEIIFNVWLEHKIEAGELNKKDIKELPFIYMEKINWFRKGMSFLKAKLFHKKYDSSF